MLQRDEVSKKAPWVTPCIVIFALLMIYVPLRLHRELDSNNNTTDEITFSIAKVGDREFSLELAETKEQKRLGLSGRESLEKDSGLLFVYDKPQIVGIWMKDMNFDIDVMWLNEKGEIIHLVEEMSPDSYIDSENHESYGPEKPTSFVLEVNSGVVREANFIVGDIVELR